MYNSNFLATFLLFSFLSSGCKVRNGIYNDSGLARQGGCDIYLSVSNLQDNLAFLETDLLIDNSFITTDYLKWAIMNNDLPLANALLQKGVNIDINMPCEDGTYLLQSVVKSGNKDMVEFILKNFNDVDINIKGSHIVPLAIAVFNGYKDIVELLLENGADYNIPNKECMLPFHIAAFTNNVDILKIFLENGIDVDIKVPNSNCGTALNYAHMAGSKESFYFLLGHGANINDIIKTVPLDKSSRTEILKNRIKLIDTSRGQEYLTLGIAIQDQEVDFIKLLLETFKHININSKDAFGYTPLHWAATIGNLEIVKLLLANGADPSIKDDKYGQSPLNLAVAAGNKDVVEELSSHKKGKSFFSSWW